MIANVRPCSEVRSEITSNAYGNVWIVTMMIGVPDSSASASSEDFEPVSPSMWATTPLVRLI